MSNEIVEIDIPIMSGWSEKHVTQFCPALLKNLWIDKNISGDPALLSTSGLNKPIMVASEGAIRGMHDSDITEDIHLAAGQFLYRMDKSLNPIFGYKINTDVGLVSINSTISEVAFTDGLNLYLYNKTTSVYSKVTSINVPPYPGDISVLGARLFINETNTPNLHIGNINDGSTWTGNVIQIGAGSYPEEIISHAVLKGRLFIFGTRSTEVWYLDPSGTYPFIIRDENVVLEYGCVAKGSVACEGGLLIWLARSREGTTSVVYTTGGVPEKLSSNEIESELQSIDVSMSVTMDDATGFIYTIEGTTFYQLNFTQANRSFLCNINNKTWCEVGYGKEGRHLADVHSYFNGIHLVGSYNSAKIFRLDNSCYTDDDKLILRKFRTINLYPANGKKFILHKVRVWMEQGTGSSNNAGFGTDVDPLLYMAISRDGGKYFAGYLEGEVGRKGKTEWVTDYYKLGYFEYGSMSLDFEHYHHTPCNIFKIKAWISSI